MFTVKNTVFDIHYARGITLIDSSLNPMSGRVMVMSGIMIISLLSSTTNIHTHFMAQNLHVLYYYKFQQQLPSLYLCGCGPHSQLHIMKHSIHDHHV